MNRIRFGKEINKIHCPGLASPKLKDAFEEEVKYFLKRNKINKDANIALRYSGGAFFDIIIER